MTSRRILHVDLHASWGGGQRQALLLARALADRGHTQWIAAPPGSALGEQARADGLEVVAFPRRAELDPRATLAMTRLMRQLEPDVVHAHDAHAVTPALLAARLARPRPAVVAHRRVAFPIRRGILSRWKYARGPDRVIAISRRARDVLVACGVPSDRVVVIHSAVDLTPAPSPPGQSLRERLGAAGSAPLVFTLAALVPAKDHPTLIEAAARLRPREPGTRWAVGGEGRLLEAMRSEVARRGLDGRVRYLGFLDDGRARIREADVFVLTSSSEALGTSLLDAMAAGVPVVATRVGGIPEVVEHERTGLLAPSGDAAAIAAAIDRLLDDRALARQLADAALERVRSYDVTQAAEATERVYDEAIATARG